MKHVINLGEQLRQDPEEPAIGDIELDIDELIRSKALIQGNSGAGKSGLIRVIVEQTASRIPTIIIDPESEFASLREKLDMVLVGDQGELKPDERSAGLLARKLAEMNASAILDIYDLKGERKHLFVQNYLEALLSLPRKLWRPTLIVMDEAQLFAPEKGFGDSAALDAVQDWMFRGRKRGLGSILATPRLSMLNKNVAGANNIFIGRTQLDVDQKRAGKALGMNEREAVSLRELKKRQFYCFGPALNVSGVTMFHVATCETTIPEPGVSRHLTLPKASHVVSEMKEKLKDLEQEAEVEIKTLNEAKAELAKLKRELKAAKAGQTPREQDTKRIQDLEAALDKARAETKTETKVVEKKIVIAATITRAEKVLERAEKLRDSLQEAVGALNTEVVGISSVIAEARKLNEANLQPAPGTYAAIDRSKAPTAFGPTSVKIERVNSATGAHSAARPSSVTLSPARGAASSNGSGDLSPLHRQILNGIALLHNIGEPEPTIAQVGAVIGKSHNAGRIRGGFNQVHEMGYAEISGNKISLTSVGTSEAVALDIRSRADIHNLWYQRLKGNELEFLRVLINNFPDSVRLSDLGAAIGKDINAGRIRGALNALFEKGLATLEGDAVTASNLLFPPGLS